MTFVIPEVLGALHERVPRNAKVRLTKKLTQIPTKEEGKPPLKELLEGAKALMRVSRNWDEFMDKLNIAYPTFGDRLPLPFLDAPRLEKPQ